MHLAGVPCALTYEEIGSYRGQHLCLWRCRLLVLCECGRAAVDVPYECLGLCWGRLAAGGHGHCRQLRVALTADRVEWSYMNLWSSKTTWGKRPSIEGDSVVITYGEYIVLDASPPTESPDHQGKHEFSRDVRHIALNCSYIVLHYSRLFIKGRRHLGSC